MKFSGAFVVVVINLSRLLFFLLYTAILAYLIIRSATQQLQTQTMLNRVWQTCATDSCNHGLSPIGIETNDHYQDPGDETVATAPYG